MFRKSNVGLFIVAVCCLSGIHLHAQMILEDLNGPNLYVAGTPGDDIVFVWEKDGELLVSVNGQVTNVTQKAGVSARQLHSVGANLYGGDDIISYLPLPAIHAGTVTNGGTGYDTVFTGEGKHTASNVATLKNIDADELSGDSVPPAVPETVESVNELMPRLHEPSTGTAPQRPPYPRPRNSLSTGPIPPWER